MNDLRIISLYWNRDEEAVTQTRLKYGRYLNTIAYNILANREDSEECLSDTCLKVWNAIPEDRPSNFRAYIGKIARNLSLNRYHERRAQKRGGGEVELLLSELEGCVPALHTVEGLSELSLVTAAIDKFLEGLGREERALFVRRYWYANSIRDLARLTGYSESKIKSLLYRLRNRLKIHLEEEGVAL